MTFYEAIFLGSCCLLMSIALVVRSIRKASKTLDTSLDMILGPERLAHVQRDQAWRRINP